MAIRVTERECLRCGHKWMPRKAGRTLRCPRPKCGSPYWDRPRVARIEGTMKRRPVAKTKQEAP